MGSAVPKNMAACQDASVWGWCRGSSSHTPFGVTQRPPRFPISRTRIQWRTPDTRWSRGTGRSSPELRERPLAIRMERLGTSGSAPAHGEAAPVLSLRVVEAVMRAFGLRRYRQGRRRLIDHRPRHQETPLSAAVSASAYRNTSMLTRESEFGSACRRDGRNLDRLLRSTRLTVADRSWD